MLTLRPHQIEDYLRSKNLRIRRRGQKAEIFLCPFCNGGEHKDRWKCVVFLDDSGGNFKCMRGSCDQSGSFWQLAEHFGDDPKQFYERDIRFDNPKPKPLRKEIVFQAEPVEPQKLTDVATEYLTRRGFGPDVLDDVAIWCDEKGLINFGYYHKGDLCMVKVRQPRRPEQTEQKAWQKWKGGLRTLWGLEQCDFTLSYLVIVFGEYDRIVVRQTGIENVVSVPCGDNDLEWISVCFEELEKFNEIILWIDNDKSGQECLAKIAERLGREKIRVVQTDFKDANEMLVRRAREVADEVDDEIRNAIFTAEWYFKSDLIQLVDVPDRELSFEGYRSGFNTIDRALGGFIFGSLTVHTGSSKHGKSSGVNQIMAAAIQQGARVCAWAGEDAIEDFKYKMYVHIAGEPGVEMVTSSRTGNQYAKVLPEYKARIDQWLREKLFVLNRRSGVTEENLFENFELAFKRFGCDVYVVDNLMKLVASKHTDNLNFRQAQVVNRASDFAKDFKVHLHVITHTNKSGGENEPPTKNSVSGAKEITNLADSVLAWWRVTDAARETYNGAESLCVVLANRAFGEEPTANLLYESRLKRYGETLNALHYPYSL